MIRELDISNFTVFKGAHLSFGDRINVIIGENGAGKTHLLKVLYAMAAVMKDCVKADEVHFSRDDSGAMSELLKTFYAVFNVVDNGDLLNWHGNDSDRKITASVEEWSNPDRLKKLYTDSIQASVKLVTDFQAIRYETSVQFENDRAHVSNDMISSAETPVPVLWPKCVFLPCRELLSIFPHYLSLRREYSLPYDLTVDDTIAKLGLPARNGMTSGMKSIIAMLEEAIQGTVFLKNEAFFYHETSSPMGLGWEIDMIAEGWRKLGMLLQLMLNGSLREGSVLFWDEPEANLNPRLIRLVAQVIVELSKQGIQVFLTTHNLFLLDELEIIIGQNHDGIRFFNLQKDGPAQQGNCFADLQDVLLVDESLDQSDRYFAQGHGGRELK